MRTSKARPAIPPTTLPIIAGVFLLLPPLVIAEVAVAVLEEGVREDSTPPVF